MNLYRTSKLKLNYNLLILKLRKQHEKRRTLFEIYGINIYLSKRRPYKMNQKLKGKKTTNEWHPSLTPTPNAPCIQKLNALFYTLYTLQTTTTSNKMKIDKKK